MHGGIDLLEKGTVLGHMDGPVTAGRLHTDPEYRTGKNENRRYKEQGQGGITILTRCTHKNPDYPVYLRRTAAGPRRHTPIEY